MQRINSIDKTRKSSEGSYSIAITTGAAMDGKAVLNIATRQVLAHLTLKATQARNRRAALRVTSKYISQS